MVVVASLCGCFSLVWIAVWFALDCGCLICCLYLCYGFCGTGLRADVYLAVALWVVCAHWFGVFIVVCGFGLIRFGWD